MGKKQHTFTVNSFFAGIGGFDIAFEQNGFKSQFFCEINPFCQKVLSSHWPDVKLATDICKLSSDDIPNADVWCGGFPCQDISVARGASERLGLNGSRSGLFYTYAKLIEAKKPEVVIIENVEGLFNSNNGRDFGTILQTMTSMGYSVAWRLVNSRYFGVPQSRSRVYMCCWKNDPIKATHVMFDKEGAAEIKKDRTAFLTESINDNDYPKVPQVAYCLAASSGRHTGTDWSRTYVVCEDGIRRLTPTESERLQGFPANWTKVTCENDSVDEIDTLRYTAIGNAVSTPVVGWIANRVKKELSHNQDEKDFSSYCKEYVPEFAKSEITIGLSKINFLDDEAKFVWPKAGIAFEDSYLGGKMSPAPHREISSVLIDCIDIEKADSRYYISPNAAEGILRRVDKQGRTLFQPLREALEKEKKKNNK